MVALVCSFVLLFAPALPVAFWVLRRTKIDALVVAICVPAASTTITFTVTRFWPGDRIGRGSAIAYLVLTVVASIASIVWARRDGLRIVRPRSGDHPRLALTIGVLSAAMTISAVAWLSGIGHLAAPTPNNDGANHDFMATRIVEAGTNEPDQVILGGPEGLSASANYYPLGLHSMAAVAAAASDATTPESINALLLFAVAALFPLGAFAFTRVLAPEFPYAAPAAALMSVGVSAAPYDAISWGSVTTAIGLGLVLPIGALVISTVRVASRNWAAGVFLGLSAVGLFHIHNTELFAAFIVAGVVLLLDRNPESGPASPPRSIGSLLGDVVQAGMRGGVVAIFLIAPIIPEVLGGASEREGAVVVSGIDPFRILGQAAFMSLDGFATERHGWVLLLSILGLGVCIRRGRYALPALFAGAVAAATWSVYGNSFLRYLTYPWYRNSERLTYNVVLIAFVATGVLLGAVIQRSTRLVHARAASGRAGMPGHPEADANHRADGAGRLVSPPRASRATRRIEVGVAGAMLLALTIALVIPGARQGHRVVADSFDQFSLAERETQRAFRAIERIAGSRGTVIAAPAADGMWAYSLIGAEPLFAIYLGDIEGGRDRSFWERLRIQEHLDRLGRVPEYDALVAKYRVRAVYLRTDTGPLAQNYRTELVIDDLQSNDGLRLAFHEGNQWVYEVVAKDARN